MQNVIVIEDKNNLLGNGIEANIESSLLQEPIDIQDAEEWEDRLTKLNIPYVLVEAEMKCSSGTRKKTFVTGYAILLRKDDLSKEFTFIMNPALDAPKESLEDDVYTVHL
jgi:hypothetical protein